MARGEKEDTMAAKSKGPVPRSAKKDAEFEDLLRRAEKFQRQARRKAVLRRGRKRAV